MALRNAPSPQQLLRTTLTSHVQAFGSSIGRSNCWDCAALTERTRPKARSSAVGMRRRWFVNFTKRGGSWPGVRRFSMPISRASFPWPSGRTHSCFSILSTTKLEISYTSSNGLMRITSVCATPSRAIFDSRVRRALKRLLDEPEVTSANRCETGYRLSAKW
jgi:hypothetical protein